MNQASQSLPAIPHVRLLGIRIHAFTIPMLHETMGYLIREKKKAIVANVNIHAMNIAYEEPWFRSFLNEADYVFCDGHGVMLGAKLCGYTIPEKITYAHWFPLFCQFCANENFTLYLLGGDAGVAERAKQKMESLIPTLRIVGVQDGFFNKEPGCEENRKIIAQINRAKPDVLLASMGMPLQEKWLHENWSRIDAHIALTGGACLDYMAGKSKRPPVWMTSIGLEWLGRMMYEPARLWRRYLFGNPLFMARLVLWQIMRLRTKQSAQ